MKREAERESETTVRFLKSDILKCAKIHCLHILLLFIEFVCDGPPKNVHHFGSGHSRRERSRISEFYAYVSRVNFLFFRPPFSASHCFHLFHLSVLWSSPGTNHNNTIIILLVLLFTIRDGHISFSSSLHVC